MGNDVEEYIRAIPQEHRPLFDRVQRLILAACPDVEVVYSYKMPTYQFGRRRLHVGVWKHGISIYGWKAAGDGGLLSRHPDLQTSTGTIRLSSDRASEIADEEISGFVRAVLQS